MFSFYQTLPTGALPNIRSDSGDIINFRQQDGSYFIDLSQTLPSGRLAAGQKITSRTLTIDNSDKLIADFNASIYAIPATAPSPLINSTPVTLTLQLPISPLWSNRTVSGKIVSCKI